MALRRVVIKLHNFIASMLHIFSMLFLKAASTAMQKVNGLVYIGGEQAKCNKLTLHYVRN
jgi:hypothetical protein